MIDFGNVLVPGGSVFVGKHLVDQLVEAGHEVAVLNRGVTPTELPKGVTRLVADRTDLGQLRAAMAGRDWDAVFDVSGFVRAAGGSDIDGPSRSSRWTCRQLRVHQFDHGVRPVARWRVPVDGGPADECGRANWLRRLQGDVGGGDAVSSR